MDFSINNKVVVFPAVCGILASFPLELIAYPAIQEVWKWNFELKRRPAT